MQFSITKCSCISYPAQYRKTGIFSDEKLPEFR